MAFEDKERAEEARFASEREWKFRVTAHRNKLLARWAATKMGIPRDEAERYATDFAVAEIDQHDEGVIMAALRGDFMAHGLVVPESEIRTHLDHFAKIAGQELTPERSPQMEQRISDRGEAQ